MRTCAVPGCKGRFSFNGSKVHKLPDIEPMRSEWIKAVPALGETSIKAPSVCCIHFVSSNYGKNRKYLKPTAVPSRHLNLDAEKDSLPSENNKPSLEIPEINHCDKDSCQDMFLTAKSLTTYNQRLIAHIKSLEKKIECLEEQNKKPHLKESLKLAATESGFMLGPTQIRCLLNKTTKGRHWTVAEKEKAIQLKKMCTHRCYNFVRKNVVPLPCTWELNDSIDKGEIKSAEESAPKASETVETYVVRNESDLKSGMIQLQNINENVETVHHIVVPPEVWAEGHQKIEFIVTENTEHQI